MPIPTQQAFQLPHPVRPQAHGGLDEAKCGTPKSDLQVRGRGYSVHKNTENLVGTPFSEMYPYHTGWLMLYCTHTTRFSRGYIAPVPHGSAGVQQPLPYISPAYFGNSFTCIWYVAYHIYLGLIFQCEFNHDVCFVIGLPNLGIVSGMLDMEHIIYIWDLFFNANSTVMFVLWSDYLIWQLFWECLIWSISYMFGTYFSIWIQP
jgi:hypothetical protein